MSTAGSTSHAIARTIGVPPTHYRPETRGWLIHYHASIHQRIDVNRVDRRYGYCYGVDCPSDVIEYEAGTLVLDIVDSRTNRVIWRGWAQDTVEGVLDNEDEMARQINEAITRMLARLPRL